MSNSVPPPRLKVLPGYQLERALPGSPMGPFARRISGSRLRDLPATDHPSTAMPDSTIRREPGSGPMTSATSPVALDDQTKARQFSELALPYLDDAYNFARWLTHSAADAEDVVQDAYMRAFQYFAGFNGTNPRAWILAIVRNSYHAWVRKNRSGSTVPLTMNSGAPGEEEVLEENLHDPDQVDAEAALIKKSEATHLRRFIAALPTAYRETLVLRELEDLTYQQIAELTAVPIGTVMSRLARARGLLAKAWNEHQEKERGE
jgi:RNA polymerase sigma factor (sigma-70 family)